jgi:hypothetical protein
VAGVSGKVPVIDKKTYVAVRRAVRVGKIYNVDIEAKLIYLADGGRGRAYGSESLWLDFCFQVALAMSVRWEFCDALPWRSGQKVFDAFVHSADNASEAVGAAPRKLGRRRFDARKEREAAEVAERQKAAEAAKAETGLGDGMEILILSVGVGILGAGSALYYHWNGYHRKAKECWLVVSLSILFHTLLAAVLFA